MSRALSYESAQSPCLFVFFFFYGGPMPDFAAAQRLYELSIASRISPDDLATIVAWPESEIALLFAAADQVRRRFFNDMVDPCTLLNIKSGNCSEDCAFCAQSSHNHAEVNVHDLVDAGQIIAAGRQAHANNCSFCVVSSGRKLSLSEIRQVAAAIRSLSGPVHASLGILSDEEFKLLHDAGVVCYNHNIETSRDFFPSIVSTHTFDERVETVRRAKKAGMRVCCGGIFGMGETWADRISVCRELMALDVDTIPLNFLNAIPGTRVVPSQESALDFLKIVAMFRLANPTKIIKVCGGRELHLGKLQGLMFLAGANGYVAGNYLTTSGDSIASDDAMIAGLGLRKAPA
jgi:biotin synthase